MDKRREVWVAKRGEVGGLERRGGWLEVGGLENRGG